MALVWRGRNGPRGLFENDDKMDNDRAWFEIDRGKGTCVLEESSVVTRNILLLYAIIIITKEQ